MRIRFTSEQVAAWLGLAVTGTTMVSFNMWHAEHVGLPEYLAFLTGIGPVAVAMILSHIGAAGRRGKLFRAITFAVMGGAIVLSVRATGYVLGAALGWGWWLFGGVTDVAALVCLHVILTAAAPPPRPAAVKKTAAAPAAKPAVPAVAPPPPAAAPAADISTKDRARLLLAADSGITGSELGRRVGLSPRQGRDLKNQLEAELAAAR